MPYIEQDNWKRWVLIGIGAGLMLGVLMGGMVYWMQTKGMGNPDAATPTRTVSATPTKATSVVTTPQRETPSNRPTTPTSAATAEQQENVQTLPSTTPSQPTGELKTGYYNEQQLFDALLLLAQDRGLLLSAEKGVIMENGTITLYDVNSYFGQMVRTEIVASIYAENGEIVVAVLKAGSGGTSFPETLRKEIESDVRKGFTSELKNDFEYTYIESITINAGIITLTYY